MKRYIMPSLILAVSFMAGGCSKTPLEKLKSNEDAPEFTVQFWKSQAKENPEFWKQALDFCAGKLGEAGNCQNVLWANTQLQEEKSYKSHSITLPKF